MSQAEEQEEEKNEHFLACIAEVVNKEAYKLLLLQKFDRCYLLSVGEVYKNSNAKINYVVIVPLGFIHCLFGYIKSYFVLIIHG